ncbi:hypothetical protein [Aetokthonos hydrillicola]|nr:hypothetical protein [Aetokthonos hydrillicola]
MGERNTPTTILFFCLTRQWVGVEKETQELMAGLLVVQRFDRIT